MNIADMLAISPAEVPALSAQAASKAAGQSIDQRGASHVATGDWFAIRGDWLHVAERRIKLSAVISYRTSAGDVEISYGTRPQDTVTLYGPHSEGTEWGGPAKALVAALDDFFANAGDDPQGRSP